MLIVTILTTTIDDEKQARVFYKYVMGGGGFDIHYGIFRKPTDTVYESSKATNERLLTCLDWTFPVTKDSYVLDLGSGHGGISHEVRALCCCCWLCFSFWSRRDVVVCHTFISYASINLKIYH